MTDANTVPVDTSRERIEKLHSIGCADYIHLALLAERDSYKARAERAEEVLRWLDEKIEEHCTHTGSPARIKDEKGNWHSGPAAEICQKVLRALQKLSRATLAQIDAEPAEPRQPVGQGDAQAVSRHLRNKGYLVPISVIHDAFRALAEGNSQ